MTFDPLLGVQVQINTISRELAKADFTPEPHEGHEDHELHAAGQECARCHEVIEDGRDVRRKASGDWVHENC